LTVKNIKLTKKNLKKEKLENDLWTSFAAPGRGRGPVHAPQVEAGQHGARQNDPGHAHVRAAAAARAGARVCAGACAQAAVCQGAPDAAHAGHHGAMDWPALAGQFGRSWERKQRRRVSLVPF
jgi:hypothetical protein